jgi:hypothetical protein
MFWLKNLLKEVKLSSQMRDLARLCMSNDIATYIGTFKKTFKSIHTSALELKSPAPLLIALFESERNGHVSA